SANRHPINRRDDVVRAQTGVLRGAGHAADDEATRVVRQAQPLDDAERYIAAALYAEIRIFDAAFCPQLFSNAQREVGRDRKTDAGVRAVFADNLRIDADHFPGHVEQRPAAVAGIDRRVSLDDRADVKIAEAVDGAIQCADDPRGHRPFLAERAADREG